MEGDDEIAKEEGVQSKKWALLTLHPWLPSRSEQVARARAWGVVETMLGEIDVSALIVDDVRGVKRTTNWPGLLKNRARALLVWKELELDGGQVFFATPLCVGFSEAQAKAVIEAVWASKMQVYVHSTCALYAAGDDLTEFLEAVKGEANAAHVRASRRRRAGIELPADADELPKRGRPAIFENKPCVYRHFTEQNELLYVGACQDYTARRKAHMGSSEWRKAIHREEVTYFDTMREALDAERDMIASEKPEYNVRRLAPKKQKPESKR